MRSVIIVPNTFRCRGWTRSFVITRNEFTVDPVGYAIESRKLSAYFTRYQIGYSVPRQAVDSSIDPYS